MKDKDVINVYAMRNNKNSITRRGALRRMAAAGITVSVPSILFGCAPEGGDSGGDAGSTGGVINSPDVAGIWSVNIQGEYLDCSGETANVRVDIEIIQNGTILQVYNLNYNENYSGTINGNKAVLQGSFTTEDGFTTSKGTGQVSINLSFDGDQVSGTEDWTWTEDGTGNTCSGTSSYSGFRVIEPMNRDGISDRPGNYSSYGGGCTYPSCYNSAYYSAYNSFSG